MINLSIINSSNPKRVNLYIDPMDIEICRQYADQRWRCDFYATTIGASLVVFLGVLGNAATLFTLSGRRLTTATFVYYRAIACVDLCRCIFVFTYVLRVLVPFRRYYWTSWYEAHLMYFIIGTLGFVSTTLAVFLCFRLCYCIVQSRRLKKMHTNPGETRRIIYAVATFSFFINIWLCFAKQVRQAPDDECYFGDDNNSRLESEQNNETLKNLATPMANIIGSKKYVLAPSEFSYAHSSLLKAVNNIPIVVLLILLISTLALLLLCILAFSGVKQRDILSNRDSSTGNSRTWRTQRQLCRLFLFLSLSYAFGLLPSLIYEFFFNNDSSFAATSSTTKSTDADHGTYLTTTIKSIDNDTYDLQKDVYENLLASITRRQISATILNVFQNFAHAISFYVYVSCSEEFRNEFVCKLTRIGCNLRRAYSSVRFSRLSTMRTSARSSPVSPLIGDSNDVPLANNRRIIEGVPRDQFLLSPQTTRIGRGGPESPNQALIRNQRSPKLVITLEQALLSENEGDYLDEIQVEPRNRAQSDLRFCRGIRGLARELSCHFYAGKIGGVRENEENADGHCLVFETVKNGSASPDLIRP